MSRNTLRFLHIIFGVVLIVAGSSFGIDSAPKAYLSPAELLDLYEAMCSGVYNVDVSYTNNLEKAEGNSPMLQSLTRFDATERIEEGAKYHVRSTSSPEGFEGLDGPNEVSQHACAFDGSATSVYWPSLKAGSIEPGRTRRGEEIMNLLWVYMLLFKIDPYNDEPTTRIRNFFGANSCVRPQLEHVSGEWCHVVDRPCAEISRSRLTVWMAADKGGLPIKFERYGGETCVERILISKVGFIDTDTGKFWYPQEGTKERRDREGYRLYRFSVKSLRANIETGPDTFRVSFPPDTDIIDRVAGIYYTTGIADEKKRYGALEGESNSGHSGYAPEAKVAVQPPSMAVVAGPNESPSSPPAIQGYIQPAQTTSDGRGPSVRVLVIGLFVLLIVGLSVAAVLMFRKSAAKRTP
ncbi:MAG TPA: hypothetical protein VMX13_05035 [Sedimentisphaerales bacterium]|nr:hypothetical protein [Sedimentisphaerales bacterium]